MNNPQKIESTIQISSKELLQIKTSIRQLEDNYQSFLLQANIQEALDFWLKNAREMFEDRGTISNCYAYIKDLIAKGILSTHDSNACLKVGDLNGFHSELIDRINYYEKYSLNDRRYRVKALTAFVKFLSEQTKGKVKRIVAPPMLTLMNDSLPHMENESLKPRVLTKEEFECLCEQIKRPQNNVSANLRDWFVIELMYQTARPLLDILAIQIGNIDLMNECVTFSNSQNVVVSIPISTKLKNGLECYLGYSQSYRKDDRVFITREGNAIFRTHFYAILKQASKEADLGFIASLKMIQWSFVANRIQKDKSPLKIMQELKLKKIPKTLESGD